RTLAVSGNCQRPLPPRNSPLLRLGLGTMPLWLQHTLVLVLVAVCVAAVIGGAVRTFAGRRSRLGSCCSKGCDPAPKRPDQPAPERIVFIPSASLRRPRSGS